jgi:hypothetical protein
MTVQSEIHAAFQWVCRMYDEARALMADVDQAFDERGFARLGTSTLTAYGSTLRATDPRQDDYPVVYIATQFFYLPEDDAANEGTAAFVAISFHDRRRTGPTLLAGTTRWTDANARLDHWLINATARAPGWRGAFTQQADGSITRHTPTAQGKTNHPGIASVSSTELPLTHIDGQERVRSLVEALVAMREGREEEIRRFVEECANPNPS